MVEMGLDTQGAESKIAKVQNEEMHSTERSRDQRRGGGGGGN